MAGHPERSERSVLLRAARKFRIHGTETPRHREKQLRAKNKRSKNKEQSKKSNRKGEIYETVNCEKSENIAHLEFATQLDTNRRRGQFGGSSSVHR
jgi:hypothetical protein